LLQKTMKKITILLLSAFAVTAASAQTSIELKDIGAHIGDSVRVCGTVYGGRFFAKDSLTLLNVGGLYPNQLLTVLLRPEARVALTGSPETDLKDKTICVTGKVILYHDKPEIIVYRRDQVGEVPKQ
jgi:hypothetical protein